MATTIQITIGSVTGSFSPGVTDAQAQIVLRKFADVIGVPVGATNQEALDAICQKLARVIRATAVERRSDELKAANGATAESEMNF